MHTNRGTHTEVGPACRTGIPRRRLLGAAAAALVMRTPARAQAGPPTVTLKLGNDLPASHTVNRRLSEAILAIAAETNGRIAIRLFPNNQLGADPSMLFQLRSGALELATMPGTILSTLIPATSLTGLGFIFTGYDKVWPAMDGAVGGYVRERIAHAGLHPFETVWDNGFRQITSSTHPIQTPDDLRNFKIRVPNVALWVSMFSALGAAPTSIPLGEAYPALQTKVADGQENPLALISAAKFYEVQRYCSLTNHAWDGFWLLANGRVWAGLPEADKAVMVKHFTAAGLKQRADSLAANNTVRATLEGKGLVFNTTDSVAFRQALAKTPFYETAKAKFGSEAWELLERHAGAIG